MFRPVQFGKYYLTDRIAVGGMAEIYRATLYGVSGFEKPMVVKQILPQYARNAEFIKMFIDEAKIAVSLSHGNIIPVYELGRIDGVYFIAMEFVEGRNLAQIMEAAHKQSLPLSPEHAIFIATETCKGLDYAHRRTDEDGTPLGVVHRDISPSNVLVTMGGEVKIADFGIAKATDKLGVTEAGVVKGSYGYMSPEQIQGQDVDHRTDIFSTGILLHEMVTGRRLFEGSDAAMVERIKEAIVTLPSVISPQAPVELDPVILQALQKDPKDRFSDANEFQLALSRILFSIGVGATSATLAAYMRKLFPPKTPRSRELLVTPKPPEIDEFADELDGTHSFARRDDLEQAATRNAVRLRTVEPASDPETAREHQARGQTGSDRLPLGAGPGARDSALEIPDVPELHEKARAPVSNSSDAFARALVAAHTVEQPAAPAAPDTARERLKTKVDRPSKSPPAVPTLTVGDALDGKADLAREEHHHEALPARTPSVGGDNRLDLATDLVPSGPANPADGLSTSDRQLDDNGAGQPAALEPVHVAPKRKRGPRSDASVMALLLNPGEQASPAEPDISLLNSATPATIDEPGADIFAKPAGAPLLDPGRTDDSGLALLGRSGSDALFGPGQEPSDAVGPGSSSEPDVVFPSDPRRIDPGLPDVPTGEIPRPRRGSGVIQSTMQLFVQGIAEERESTDDALAAIGVSPPAPRAVKPTVLGWVLVLLLVGAAAFFVIYKKTSLFTDRRPKNSDSLLKVDDIKTPPDRTPPVEKKGTIELSSKTPNALIYQHVGQTPIKLDLAKNRHIRAERSGYRTIHKTIDDKAFQDGTVSLALQPTGAQADNDAFPEGVGQNVGGTGGAKKIAVRSEPPSATLWLLVGRQGVKLQKVVRRRYYFKVIAQGYQTGFISISKGQFEKGSGTVNESISLTPLKTDDQKTGDRNGAAAKSGDKKTAARGSDSAAAKGARIPDKGSAQPATPRPALKKKRAHPKPVRRKRWRKRKRKQKLHTPSWAS